MHDLVMMKSGSGSTGGVVRIAEWKCKVLGKGIVQETDVITTQSGRSSCAKGLAKVLPITGATTQHGVLFF